MGAVVEAELPRSLAHQRRPPLFEDEQAVMQQLAHQ